MKIFRLGKTWMFAAFVAAALACAPAFAGMKSKVAEDDDMSGLMEMSDQLDEIDSQDFYAAIERATSCTRMRNFTCAEAELTKAEKSANGGKEKKILLASRQSLADERQELANETKRAEEARLRIAEAAQAERRRQQEAEESRSSGFQWGKALVMLGTGAVVGGGMSSEAQGKFVEGVLKDSMPGQDGISNTTANANAYAAEQKVRQDIADQQFRDRQAKKMLDETANNERLLQAASDSRQPNGGQQAGRQAQVDNTKLAAAPREEKNSLTTASPVVVSQASRSNETWHDEYSNTVTKTGVTKSFPDHERNIPVSYIASKLKDRASAEAVWSDQGGKVIDFYGSIAGGRITVVVDFGYIKDTHVYVRDK